MLCDTHRLCAVCFFLYTAAHESPDLFCSRPLCHQGQHQRGGDLFAGKALHGRRDGRAVVMSHWESEGGRYTEERLVGSRGVAVVPRVMILSNNEWLYVPNTRV